MSQQAERGDEVVGMVRYLRDTIAETDRAVARWLQHRTELAQRLAALEDAHDALTLDVAVDYLAGDAELTLSEAHGTGG